MANIGTLLKQEISRLARRQVRSEVESMRRASAQYRRDIAALKRQAASLGRQLSRLAGTGQQAPAVPSDGAEKATRFVPKGLRAHRVKLGLSAADYGKLAGVSAQSIYNWERGIAKPRGRQRATLSALRALGKREAQARLAQHSADTPKARRNGAG